MPNLISNLKSGDLVYLISPAKAIEEHYILHAKHEIEKRGYRVKLGKHVLKANGYLAGTDAERMQDFQEALDDPNCKAIFCARGGYGSLRIVDRLNWAGFIQYPKWIIGFSDITVFHCYAQHLGFPSIHATMPLNYAENSPESLDSLFTFLGGKPSEISYSPNPSSFILEGTCEGTLIGGNLSLIYALMGTPSEPDFQNAILFIEEVGEYLYALDRMLTALQYAGVFDKIRGLIVGGMTQMKDTTPPLGLNLNQLIQEKTWFRGIPVCMDFPAGHLDDNRCLVLGHDAQLTVSKNQVTLSLVFSK